MLYRRLLESRNRPLNRRMVQILKSLEVQHDRPFLLPFVQGRAINRTFLERAHPFVLTPEAWALAGSVAPRRGFEEGEMLELIRRPLPFPDVFVELPPREDSSICGVLISRTNSGDVAVQRLDDEGASDMEPLVSLLAEPGAEDAVVLVDDAMRAMLERFRPEGPEVDLTIEQLIEAAAGETCEALVMARMALDLLTARNSPYEGERASLMSRQERRALERAGRMPEGPAPTVTRIRLGESGRAHLRAVQAEGETAEEGAAATRRRAHWVRGHLMGTPTKGPVWRGAHVRGFGPVNPTTRLVEAPAPEAEPASAPEAPGF